MPSIHKADPSAHEQTSDHETSESGALIRLMMSTYPDITWDIKSALKADINDDGFQDDALVGKKGKSQIAIAVILSGSKKESKIHVLNFGVSPGRQDAVGYLPARLTIESMDYDPSEMVGKLPGFKRSKKAQGLCLDDELTDSIHIFWNHQTHELDWWRL
jgi:hypothetical protein